MKKKKLLKKLLKLESKKIKKLQTEIKKFKKVIEEKFDKIKSNDEYTEYVTLYTDASYDQNVDICSYGIIAIPHNGSALEFTGLVNSPKSNIYVDNNLGEAFAVIKALEIAHDHGYNNIEIYTDSTNVILWKEVGNGINDAMASWFYERYSQLSMNKKVNIRWMRRRTCEYNRAADNLAKKTLNIARINAPKRPEKLSGGKLCTLGELCDFSKLKIAE